MVKITIEDKNYPDKLRNIRNPPRQLYLEGNIELLKQTTISIIGSRNCTEKGKKLAEKFASELAYQGLAIASGMARGIDTAAHKGTIKAKGKTIAVLGNGFYHIFPKENTELYQKIIETGGLIVSEYSPETKPSSNLFLERNRIVSRAFDRNFSSRSSLSKWHQCNSKTSKRTGQKNICITAWD